MQSKTRTHTSGCGVLNGVTCDVMRCDVMCDVRCDEIRWHVMCEM